MLGLARGGCVCAIILVFGSEGDEVGLEYFPCLAVYAARSTVWRK